MKLSNRSIAIFVGLALLAVLFYFFSNIVGYVLIAWVLSMIGQPFMRTFQKIRILKFKAGANTAAILTLISYFIIVGLLIRMFAPLIITQANNLAEVDYAQVGKALEEPANEIKHKLVDYGIYQPDTILIKYPDTAAIFANNPNAVIKADTIEVIKPVSVEKALKDNFFKWFEPQRIGNLFSDFLAAAGNILFTLFSVIFITFFFLKEQGLFVNFLVALVPNQHEDKVRHAIEDISNLLSRYFRGIVMQVTAISIFVSIALSVLGVKNALLIGFFAALINVIPYLGPIIGAAFAVIITISSNLDLDFYTQMLPLLSKVVIVFAAMQMLDNFLLQPWIFSNSVLAHPLEIFIVILMGAQINGIVGMVLAIPVYTVLRVIARSFLSEFKIVQKITGSLNET
jgi:predicted PurR-regulated permease PerM